MTRGHGIPHVANREDAATIAWAATTRQRRSITSELFEAYWQDCHGPSVAPLPGIEFYYQHRLLADHGDNWPALPGIVTELDDAKQIDGIAQLGWRTEQDLSDFKAASEAADIPADEQNLFDVVAIQSSGPGNHKTFFDGLTDAAVNGPEPHLRLFVGLRAAPTALRADFGRHLMDHVAPAFADHELTRRVRLILCDDVEYVFRRSGHVTVDMPISDQYQAFIELIFANRYDLRSFYDSGEFISTTADLGDLVSHVNVFPVKSTMVCVLEGTITLAGRLGSARARTVLDVGAINVPLPSAPELMLEPRG